MEDRRHLQNLGLMLKWLLCLVPHSGFVYFSSCVAVSIAEVGVEGRRRT